MGHINLSSEINNNIAQSDRDGGVYLKDIPVGCAIKAQTRNTLYLIERREDGLYISGSARFCPRPALCSIPGSTWGGSMLKMGFIGIGMYIEFGTEEHPCIGTTAVQSIERVGF